jgi:RNA polymerase sigma-70 factor (ECF subfamily)
LNFFTDSFVLDIVTKPKWLERAVDLTDEALIEKILTEEDMHLFKILVRRYQQRVYASAFRLLGSSEEAEEIVQDTFLRVHQNLSKFRSNATFASWLFKISHNLSMDYMRMKQRRNSIRQVPFDSQGAVAEEEGPFTPSLAQLADLKPGPSVSMELEEQTRIIEESINDLPESQKAVLILHDFQGLSYQEIAEIVGTSIGTVRSRLHYGRSKLRENLAPYFNLPATSR